MYLPKYSILQTDESVRWRQNSWDEVTQSTTINERHTPSQKSSSSDRDPELSSEEESNKYVLTFLFYSLHCFFIFLIFIFRSYDINFTINVQYE